MDDENEERDVSVGEPSSDSKASWPMSDDLQNENNKGSASSVKEDETSMRHASITTTQPAPAPQSNVGSLDFERVINTYSIQATKDRLRHRPLARRTRRLDPEDFLLRNESDLSSDDEEMNPPSSYSTFPHHRSSEFHPTQPTGYYSGRSASRWVLVCGTGLLTGVTAIFIVSLTDLIVDHRSNLLDQLADRIHAIPEIPNVPRSYRFVFLGFLSYNLFLALISSISCLIWAPEAVGSGIPEVKAYLNGVRVKRFNSRKLFLVKIFATVLSVSSGLVIGPEGPLVHVGAILGASLTKLGPNIQAALGEEKSRSYRWLSKVLLDLSHFCTDGERRDMISIGAAAGFAAAFGAPIGGLLFSLEEASTFFQHAMLWKTLTATAIATFCLAVYRGDLSDYSVISLSTQDTPNDQIFINRFVEIPLFILVGASGGLLGALFCYIFKVMNEHRKWIRLMLGRRPHVVCQIAEVVIASLVTSTLTFWLPFLHWSCKDHTADDDIIDDDLPFTTSPEHRFNCEPGQVNELGSIFFGSRGTTTLAFGTTLWLRLFLGLTHLVLFHAENAIKGILTNPTQFDPRTLLVTGLLFFPLMSFTLGVSLPSGIFMPTVLVGSSLGGFAGMCFHSWVSKELSPSTFALLGAAALLAGIQRSTVSICVILVEGTGQTKVLIPVICTVVVARYVGDLFTEDLYGIAMEVKEYPYLEHHVNKFYDTLTAGDVMSAPPVVLKAVETAYKIARVLVMHSHHGFPVVDNDENEGGGKFLGLVRRDQLAALLECGVFMDSHYTISEEGDDLFAANAKGDGLTPRNRSCIRRHLADFMRDDRYDHIYSKRTPERKKLEDDHYDEHSWLVDTVHRHSDIDMAHIDESLPRMVYRESSSKTCVAKGEDGNLVVKLDKKQRQKRVNVQAAMNRGTYCVTETCPLSKVYEIFTSLGLRHLIVLGGASGGEIVGVVTRCNLLPDFVEERTRRC